MAICRKARRQAKIGEDGLDLRRHALPDPGLRLGLVAVRHFGNEELRTDEAEAELGRKIANRDGGRAAGRPGSDDGDIEGAQRVNQPSVRTA